MTRRFYSRTRRAWTPRFWPMVVADIAILFPASMFVLTSTLERIALGFAVGAGVGFARWEVWKWMHPEITPAEYMADIREAAPWN